jgi:hypothetical protein
MTRAVVRVDDDQLVNIRRDPAAVVPGKPEEDARLPAVDLRQVAISHQAKVAISVGRRVEDTGWLEATGRLEDK